MVKRLAPVVALIQKSPMDNEEWRTRLRMMHKYLDGFLADAQVLNEVVLRFDLLSKKKSNKV